MGNLLLLYPLKEEQIDLHSFLEVLEGAFYSINVNGDVVKLIQMTCAEHYKRQLYTDNLLQNSAAFFNNGCCELSAATIIEKNLLQFLENDLTNRIVSER